MDNSRAVLDNGAGAYGPRANGPAPTGMVPNSTMPNGPMPNNPMPNSIGGVGGAMVSGRDPGYRQQPAEPPRPAANGQVTRWGRFRRVSRAVIITVLILLIGFVLGLIIGAITGVI
jgi:hypothetical protein